MCDELVADEVMRLIICNLRQHSQAWPFGVRREEKRDSRSWLVLVPAFQHLDSSERVHIAQSSLPTM